MSARPEHRSVVLETCVRMVFHAILATSVFFLTAGHNSPGGGFVGGLVAGTAFVLRYLVTSGSEVSREVRVRPSTVLGAGLLLAVGTAMAPWLFGGQVLQSTFTYLQLPVLGALPLASVLAFDTGVYLIVVGLVLAVLASLGTRTQSSLGAADDCAVDDDHAADGDHVEGAR